MVHDMYVMQVKTPQESKYPWDYYKVLKTMAGEEAFGAITGACPLAPAPK
jgi:branched-chain amino acid transport system substrate-binding protein